MTLAATTRSAPVTIAGVGNWLVAADRVGPLVLEAAATRYGDVVDLADIGSGGLALLDVMHGQELLVVVDACVGRARPGEVIVVDDIDDAEVGPGLGVHQIGPAEALAVAREFQPELMPRRVVLVLVETGDLAEPELQRACERVLEVLDALVDGTPPTPGGARRTGGQCGRQS